MAKRKRLTPAQSGYLGDTAPEAAPEAKSLSHAPLGLAPRTRTAAPIAQVAGEASAAAALSEMTQMVDQARAEGRLILSLPLDAIATDYLVRDRLHLDSDDLDSLEKSLRARGQQTPIEVMDRGAGVPLRYGLLSGWRRMAALRRIAQDDPERAHVLAIVRQPDTAAEAYVAMVEENEIRIGLSNYERARIVAKAVEQGVYPDVTAALRGLFGNVSRAKRSKIKSFLSIVTALDDLLRYPAAIPERLGLQLAKAVEDPETLARLRDVLLRDPSDSAERELDRLAMALVPPSPEPSPRTHDPSRSETQVPAQRAPVTVEFREGEIRLAGDGVDQDLFDAVTRLLRKRGQAGSPK